MTVLVPLAAKGTYDLIRDYRKKKFITDEEAKQAEEMLIEHFTEDEIVELEAEEPPC